MHRLGAQDAPRLLVEGEIVVGRPDDVRDLGPGGLDLVGILDVNRLGQRGDRCGTANTTSVCL